MNTSHTPGPFSVVNKILYRDTATARLEVRPIEAAHALNELLAALQTMMTFEALIREHRPAAVYTLERARAAIAKAVQS